MAAVYRTFSDLPPEIRNKIYDLVMPEQIELISPSHSDLLHQHGAIILRGDRLRFMFTNRQIYEEVTGIFWHRIVLLGSPAKQTAVGLNVHVGSKIFLDGRQLSRITSLRLTARQFSQPELDDTSLAWQNELMQESILCPNLQNIYIDAAGSDVSERKNELDHPEFRRCKVWYGGSWEELESSEEESQEESSDGTIDFITVLRAYCAHLLFGRLSDYNDEGESIDNDNEFHTNFDCLSKKYSVTISMTDFRMRGGIRVRQDRENMELAKFSYLEYTAWTDIVYSTTNDFTSLDLKHGTIVYHDKSVPVDPKLWPDPLVLSEEYREWENLAMSEPDFESLCLLEMRKRGMWERFHKKMVCDNYLRYPYAQCDICY